MKILHTGSFQPDKCRLSALSEAILETLSTVSPFSAARPSLCGRPAHFLITSGQMKQIKGLRMILGVELTFGIQSVGGSGTHLWPSLE